MRRITVLISGRGSNLRALVEATKRREIDGVVTQVISSRPGVAGLAIALEHGIASTVVDHTEFGTRATFETALARAVDAATPDLVVLAGFLRLLGGDFVRAHAGRMLNIHPSLLPAYPGLHTHRRALADGVRVHGCTVHFVTPDVDVGPIVAQAAVPVFDGDDEETLAARVLAVEHRLLPAAVGWFCAGRLVIEGTRVRVKGAPGSEGVLIAPAVGSDDHRSRGVSLPMR